MTIEVVACTPMTYSKSCGSSRPPIFTRYVVEALPDDEYRSLQLALALRPEAGAVIRGSGGLRKVRWSLPGRGKRGGVRVIYWSTAESAIFMLMIYSKGQQDDLTPRQLRVLRKIVQEEFK